MKPKICCLIMMMASTQGRLAGESLEDRIRQLEERLAGLQEEVRLLRLEAAAPPRPDPSTPAEPQEPAPGPNDLRFQWNDGLRAETQDGRFKLRVGGRVNTDFALVSTDSGLEDAIGKSQDGAEIRRARLFASGSIGRMEYKAQFDFSEAEIEAAGALKDAYVGFNQLPVVGSLKVGHFKEPFGLEELTSTNHITFMERSSTSPFAPSRNVGVGFQNAVGDSRMTYAAGIFRDSNDVARSFGGDGWNYTGRLTGLPVYGDDGRRLLHLGAALSRQGIPLGTTIFLAKPESNLAQDFLNTGFFAASSVDLLGLEAASVFGPFSLQSEYVRASTEAEEVGDPSFNAFYVTGSFFATGEHRVYNRPLGEFGRVIPMLSVVDGGIGAWELAARYSQMDLNDASLQGGAMKNFTLGLNWYLNAHTRVMWNYLHSRVENTGDADILQMRLKVDF